MNQQTVYLTVSVQDELPEKDVVCFRGDKILDFTWGSRPKDLLNIKATHWLKPTTGYFFTPEEFREVLIKAQESACKQLLSDMAKGFLVNKDKVEIFSDKAVFQAIGETIQNFPLPDFQTFYNQLTGSGE